MDKNGNESSHIAQRVENIGSDAGGSAPVVLALWFAQIRAKAETSDRLHAFSQLALQKTEMVVYEADRAREKALQFKGTICSFAHQQYMLSVVRSLLYVDDLIYADGTRLFCSTAVRPDTAWRIPPANYTKSRISLSTTIAIRLSIPALR
jgi:sensor c-di-GMP phosphodiesterase-like protein